MEFLRPFFFSISLFIIFFHVPGPGTRYRLGFEKAFNLLKASASDENGKSKTTRVILFLTDEAPPEDEEGPIFQTIRDMNLELNNSVVILTFGFGNVNSKTEEILQDIAKQNTAKYIKGNKTVGDIKVNKK